MSGRQQQDQQPPRRAGRALPSQELYQPRRRHEQLPTDPADRPVPQSSASTGGARRGTGSGGGRQPRAGPGGGSTGSDSTARHQAHPRTHHPRGGSGNVAAQQHPHAHSHPQPRQQLQPQLHLRQPDATPAMPAAPLGVEGLVAAAGDTRQPAAARAAALQQLHQRLFDPAAQRQALQQLQVLWPRLLALLYDDPSPAVTAAAAPAVGAIGALAAQASAAAVAARAAAAASSSSGSAAAAPASRTSGSGGSASGLLFDWLLPVLQRRASPGGRPLEAHQLAAVLLALRDCLTGVDAVTLARYANAVFGACQALLEDEAAPPSALPPVLAVLQQAARHQHSLKARFQDLVDLLLGWALEPALPDAARPALMRTLAAFGTQWRQQPAFTAQLLGSLLTDMARFAAKAATGSHGAGTAGAAGTAGSSQSLRRVLALAACVVPMMDAATAARLPSCHTQLLRFLEVCTQAAAAAAAPAATASLAPSQAASAVTELASLVSRLAALAPATEAAAGAAAGGPSAGTDQAGALSQPQGQQQAAGSSDRVTVELVASMWAMSLAAGPEAAAEHVALKLSIHPAEGAGAAGAEAEAREGTQAVPGPPAAASSQQQLFAAVAAFAAAACSGSAVLAHTPTLLSVLAALRGWLQMLAQQPSSTAKQLEGPASVLLLPAEQSRQPGSSGVNNDSTAGSSVDSGGGGGSCGVASSSGGSWLLSLRTYGSREVVLQVAQLLGLLLPHSPAALQVLLADTQAQADALSSHAATWHSPPSEASPVVLAAHVAPAELALLTFNLALLEATVLQLPAASLLVLWQQLLPLAAANSPFAGRGSDVEQQPLHEVWRQLLRLLQTVGQQLAGSQQQGSAPQEAMAALASLLGSSAASERVALQALGWLQQAACWLSAATAAPSETQPAASAAARCQPGSSSSSGDSIAAALRATLSCCADTCSAAVRAAALAAACALASTGQAGAWMLRDSSAAGQLFQTALLHLSDSDRAAVAAARQLLAAAAAPLALSGALHIAAGADGGSTAASMQAATLALGPQRLGFCPAQLQQLLAYMGVSAVPAAVLAGTSQQQAAPQPQHEWLPRLLHSMQAVPLPRATDGAGGGSRGLPPEGIPRGGLPSCLSLAAWWAVQEAAKQCVASRLRTHHGGPAQTLAALEQALQVAVAHLQRQQQKKQGGPQPQQPEDEEAQQEQDADVLPSAGGSDGGGGVREWQQAAVLLLLFLHALEQGIASASSGCCSRAAAPQSAVAFFAANDKVCQAWFARVRPALVRAATAAQLHELAAYHALLRLRDLQQQLPAVLPATATAAPASAAATPLAAVAAAASLTPGAVAARGEDGTGEAVDEHGNATAAGAATPAGKALLAAHVHTGLAAATEGGSGSSAAGAPASNPAAALLAATRGSPDTALRQQSKQQLLQEPASPGAAATSSGRLAQQRAQQLAAKVAEAAAAAAAALCALHDVDGVAGLQAYCRQAFGPLLQQLYVRQAADSVAVSLHPHAAEALADASVSAAAAAAAAWDWLDAVGEQAAGRYESALGHYTRVYASPPGSPPAAMQCAPAGTLAPLVAQAYAAVGDAAGLEQWLKTKMGAKLPPGAAARCMQLARWDESAAHGRPQEPDLQQQLLEGSLAGTAHSAGVPGMADTAGLAGSAGELLWQLQLGSLDPAASSGSCSASLPGAAARLAELAGVACGGSGQHMPQGRRLQMQIPKDALLEAFAVGAEGGQQLFSAWQPLAKLAATTAAEGRGPSLHPLLLMLGQAGVSGEQRGLLLLGAAQAAAAGSNMACVQHLLDRADAALAVEGGSSSQGQCLRTTAQLLLQLQRLQAASLVAGSGAAASPSNNSSQAAWQLLLAARKHSSAAPSIVPAAAQLLLSGGERAPAGVLATEAAAVVAASQLPMVGPSMAQLEQQLLLGPESSQQGGSADPAAWQYAALKAAVAAAPLCAGLWWQWAAWLHQLATQQQQQQQGTLAGQAAQAAAFTASCQALACCSSGAASAPGGSSTSGGLFGMLPALLQVLQLLAHAGSSTSLPPDAAAQLASVPAAAWLPVVPQLLSLLAGKGGGSTGSSGSTQRDLAASLLLHVGTAAPCQVLLPALVVVQEGACAAGTAGTEPGDDQQQQQQHAPHPLLALVQQLEQRHPALAQQLRVLIAEAARLAVLPEEHWHTVLQEAAATAAKRLQAQQKAQRQRQAAAGAAGPGRDEGGEPAREEAPAGGGHAGSCEDAYLAALGPVLLALQQQVEAAEAAQPQTPHEQQFRLKHLPRLRQLLRQLTAPLGTSPAGAAAEAGAGGGASQEQRQRQAPSPMALLRAAANELAAALRPKQLALADVAPALAELAGTGIPIPGAAPAAEQGMAGGGPTLESVAGEVAVLSTKTRPKRLRLLGSDGTHHSFLLKGREDLRAEARLMQLLRACHSVLQAPSASLDGTAGGRSGSSSDLGVHCFEVTPLGSRVGLVQWVEGTVPLFELYTSWQQGRAQRRRLLAAAAANQQQQAAAQAGDAAQPMPVGGSRTGAPALHASKPSAVPQRALAPAAAQLKAQQAQQQLQLLRPVDLFYAKLKEAGIDPATPRHAWPLGKLVSVLESMQQTVDRQLLWREVWLGSASAADLWRRQSCFVGSAAAMSMVGHLLGLGDRHLDNVLLHRRGAQLVHIDFSVVFDRGLQLKVPEVVPFRLTQTLVAALGVTGVEGAFRLGCQRALGALRANVAPLCALLEAVLLDAGVNWDAETAAKAASKAFAQAVALRVFTLRQANGAAALAAAASAARAGLAAAGATLSACVAQFLAAAGTAAAAAESHALLQRCQSTLSSAAAQEEQLAAQAAERQAALEQMLTEAQPMAAQLQACLQECQAWQQRHNALLPLLLSSPPASLLAGPAASDPVTAATAGSAPLLLVSSPRPGADGSPGDGSGSILHAALGMLPSHAPLSAGLLLQAAAADKAGQQLLCERAAAAQQLAGALQQYAAAVACLLGGASYAGSSQHAHWLPAFQAAMELPVPQGFERATELAPRSEDPAGAAAAWCPLAAAAAAAMGLWEQLASTSSALQLERVDVALAAADCKQKLVDAAAGMWAAAAGADSPQARQRGVAALAHAFAEFSEEQASAVVQLEAWQEHQQGSEQGTMPAGAGEDAAADEAAALLAGMQRLILGYASTAVAVRDASSEALFLDPDGSSLLGWLSDAVQAADGVSTAAAELQLLAPALLALLHSPDAAGRVSEAVAAAAEHLDAAAEAAEAEAGAGPQHGQRQQQPGLPAGAAAEERAAAGAMAPLLAAAGRQPAVAALLQGLQHVQAAAQLLLPAGEQPSLAQQQLLLAGALVSVWQELEDAVAAETAAASSSSGDADTTAAGCSVAAAAAPAWQQCSAVLATAVAAEVSQHMLPPLAAALGSTAQQLRTAAPGLARRAGLEAAASTAAHPGSVAAVGLGEDQGQLPAGSCPPELVPFTGFDADLAGAGVLLGGLEDELEMELGDELAPARQLNVGTLARHPGGGRDGGGAEPALVPFLDFDESLAGADDLLESLEPEAEGFAAVHGGSSSQDALALSQPGVGGSMSQRSEGEGAEGAAGAGDSMPGQAEAEARRLAALLTSAAEATGALAAVDAVQYIGGLAQQQCQQMQQQHCAELAAFQWLNEHLLPPEAAAAAVSLLAGAELSPSAAAGAGVHLPPMHPAVAGWALRSSRQQLLQALQAGAGTLQGLESPLQQWQRQLAAVEQQLEEEVAAVMPFAAPALQHQLQQQQQWLQSAAAMAASVLELSQAVLQFEASRTAGAPTAQGGAPPAGGAAATPVQAAPGAAASAATAGAVIDRFQAEQQEGWQRYIRLLRDMQGLQGQYTTAQRGVAVAAAELEQLRLRRQEALSIKESAETAGSNAAANFAALALPLVKSTQQLPPAVARLLPQLAGSAEWAAQLAAAQRCAAELAVGEAAEDEAAAADARQAAEQLAAAADCVCQLAAAAEALQAVLLPARNRLLAGGRGEAAAHAQAAGVVDALSPAVTQLHSQLEKADDVQRWLAALPASLQALADRAAQRAAALQQQHGFSLQGLEELLPEAAGKAGTSGGAADAAATLPLRPALTGTLTGSLLLTATPPGSQGSERQQQRQHHAASVLQRFRAKLGGETPGRGSDGYGAGAGAAATATADVEAQVQNLISAAASRSNLARMYEGWMPWV